MEDSPYQKKKVSEKIEPLTDFLEDVQWRKGTKKDIDPHFRDQHNRGVSLNKLLAMFEEDDEEILDDEDEELTDDAVGESSGGIFLGPNQRYFMGASENPQLVIVSQVTDDAVKYYAFPWKKEQTLRKDIAADLFVKGSQTFLNSDAASNDEDLQRSIEAVLAGNPGEKVSIEDQQPTNLQVKYTGPIKGDGKPWAILEQEYDVQVLSVLTNKQTYNLRMSNRQAELFQDKLREKPISEREFKVVKIVKEDMKFYTESATKFKAEERPISPEEADNLRSYQRDNLATQDEVEGFLVGQQVLYNKEMWTIVEFIYIEDKVYVSLVDEDFTRMIDPVAISKIKPYVPEEPDVTTGDDIAVEKLSQKDRELEFPTSDTDGITQDQKVFKKIEKVEKKKLTEDCDELLEETEASPSLDQKGKEFSNKIVDFLSSEDPSSINKANLPDDIEGVDSDETSPEEKANQESTEQSIERLIREFAEKIKILTKKKRDEENFDPKLAAKAFYNPDDAQDSLIEKVANQILNLEGDEDVNLNQLKPAMQDAANRLVSEFIKQFETGVIKEEDKEDEDNIEEAEGDELDLGLDDEGGDEGGDELDLGDDEEGEDNLGLDDEEPEEEPEEKDKPNNISFTTDEKSELRKFGNVKINKETNEAILQWDDSTGGTNRVEVKKILKPDKKRLVYVSTGRRNDSIDAARTSESKEFDTREDPFILKDFLSQLNLNEETINEEKKPKKKDDEPKREVVEYETKEVNEFPLNDDGEPIKSKTVPIDDTTSKRVRYVLKREKKKEKLRKDAAKRQEKALKKKKKNTK